MSEYSPGFDFRNYLGCKSQEWNEESCLEGFWRYGVEVLAEKRRDLRPGANGLSCDSVTMIVPWLGSRYEVMGSLGCLRLSEGDFYNPAAAGALDLYASSGSGQNVKKALMTVLAVYRGRIHKVNSSLCQNRTYVLVCSLANGGGVVKILAIIFLSGMMRAGGIKSCMSV